MAPTTSAAVLLYDGDCGFCAGSVQFVLAHERPSRRGALQFAPLQGAFGQGVLQQFPTLASIDSVVWFEPANRDAARIRVKSDAALATLEHLGGGWRLIAHVARLVPRIIRDMVYDAIAKRRLQLAAPACLLPDAQSRARFLA